MPLKYTDQQIRDMLGNSSMWHDQLRTAATQRGCMLSSIAPIAEVIVYLRSKVGMPLTKGS